MPFKNEAQRRALWAKAPEVAKRWTEEEKKKGPPRGGGGTMADENFLRYLQGAGQTFNPYGAGNKVYGGGRSAPNVGPVSGTGQSGYQERDARGRLRRQQLLKRMQAGQRGRYMSPEWLRGQQ